MRETGLSTPVRSLMLLEAVVHDGGRSSVAALARAVGIPVASAHRHIAALASAGYLVPADYGRHLPGPKLKALTGLMQSDLLLANAARPVLEKLAARMRSIVQLGIFENEMVTYLVKSGQSSDALFTKVGMQLEAYCSGIGKVLLAHLPPQAQAIYLAGGPFIALTEQTITDAMQLQAELEQVANQGFAVDNEEVVTGLQCVAVPVRNFEGEVIAAISASRAAQADDARWRGQNLPLIQAAADEIGRRASYAQVSTR
jgi:IclR family transcriptional regulator, acetate operon repressor